MAIPQNTIFRLAVLFAFLAVGAVLALDAQAPVPNNVTIENFGKVNENYFRGSQPKSNNMAELKRYGVKTVIDLRNDQKADAPGWAGENGLRYFHIPLSTKKPATSEQVDYFLKLVNDPDNWPVYVHCKGGRHRTGEMTAIFRITKQNWTADEAYREMQSYDFEDSWWYPRVLKKFVFSFYDEHKAGRQDTASAGSLTVQ